MNISQRVVSIVQYLFEGLARTFRPTDDEYPVIGVQPFTGEPFKPGAD
ncbi:hypothetical protein [Synechocystis sp. PCC 7509]|nr:hypothetical protein [Synechocystis sp. PCC 7509]